MKKRYEADTRRAARSQAIRTISAERDVICFDSPSTTVIVKITASLAGAATRMMNTPARFRKSPSLCGLVFNHFRFFLYCRRFIAFFTGFQGIATSPQQHCHNDATCGNVVALSRNSEICQRGIASVFFEGGTPDEKTEFPSSAIRIFGNRYFCHARRRSNSKTVLSS